TAQVSPKNEGTGITANLQECIPVDPLSKALPANPCFQATLTAENEITLQWRVINSEPQIYIYNDSGKFDDIGFQPAECPESQNTCVTTLKVETGGFRRWLLRADHSSGAQIYVPASITIPASFAPIAVYGGGFVDTLSPTDRTISWIPASGIAECQASKENFWIEREKSFPNEEHEYFPRCGSGARFLIPEENLSEPGYRGFKFRDCHLVAENDLKFCSPYVTVGIEVGSDRFSGPYPIYTESGRELELTFSTRSGDTRRLTSTTLIPPNGELTLTTEQRYTVDDLSLTPGVHSIKLASCSTDTETCSPEDELQVIVDSYVNWEWDRDYKNDFHTGISYPILGWGTPLEITYDSNGGIWMINEFSSSVEHVSSSGTVETLTVPLARQSTGDGNFYDTVKPFAWAFNMQKMSVPIQDTTLGERAVRVGSQIWFTQGGGMLAFPADVKNHSRVISFDPALSDSPATPFDDRLCVYNVPTDDSNPLGNNQVIGITASKGRMWIGESRGGYEDTPSAISSFIPDPKSCDNLLNFEDPEALANQKLQYCSTDQTPEQDGCMQKYLLDQLPVGIKVTHLIADPVDDSIWFVDSHGLYLGNLNPDRNPIFKLYPLPASTLTFGGVPWSIEVEKDAVYTTRVANRRLLRFDKATASFDEIAVPGPTGQSGIPSIYLDAASNRLWFSVSNGITTLEDTVSTIGYIDVNSWREHIANPGHEGKVNGVIYRGLDSIDTPATLHNRSVAFAGITVDPATGKVALATAGLNRITVLTPKPGFWP
ncbi:MAG TPA: hypothetical protein VIV27_07665, partial [Halioglobus sp.]